MAVRVAPAVREAWGDAVTCADAVAGGEPVACGVGVGVSEAAKQSKEALLAGDRVVSTRTVLASGRTLLMSSEPTFTGLKPAKTLAREPGISTKSLSPGT